LVSSAGSENPDERRNVRLAIKKQRKEELVEQYVEMLQRGRGFIVTEYRGMTMKQLDELRSRLREKNAGFTITKNTLLKIALRETGMAVPEELLLGPVAVAIAYDDLPATIKTVLEYAKDNVLFVTKGGVVGESIVAADQLQALSELPPLDVLRAQLLGMVTMPLTQFLGLLEEPGRQVVGVIHAATTGVINVMAAYSQKQEAA
jgi:large subunit ribosomal protein L10